jgi:hypothetical protein
MLSVAWRTKLSLGRFLHFAKEQGAPQLAEALDRDCKWAVSLVLLRRSVFLIMCFACGFYALFLFDTLGEALDRDCKGAVSVMLLRRSVFLFDTLGDAVGLHKAYLVLIVVPLWCTAYQLPRSHG